MIHDLGPAYALDALDDDERRAFEEHLETCEDCRRDVESFLEASEALAVAASGPAPPPDLRERILEGARAERQTVVPLAARRNRVAPVLGAAAALAAAVAIGVGFYAVSVSGDLDDTRAALARERAIAAVLASPEATRDVGGVSGRLVVGAAGSAVLVLDDLDAVPDDKTYQVWVVAGGAPVSGGLFRPVDGAATVAVSEPVPDGAVVALTIEEADGAEAPTTDPIAASEPV